MSKAIGLTDYQRWLMRQRLPRSGWGLCLDPSKKAAAALAVLVRKGALEQDGEQYRLTDAGRASVHDSLFA